MINAVSFYSFGMTSKYVNRIAEYNICFKMIRNTEILAPNSCHVMYNYTLPGLNKTYFNLTS